MENINHNNRGREKYFILLEDTVGIEKKKKFIRGPTSSFYHALKGEIFQKDTSKGNDFDTEFTFVSTENPDRTIKCVEEKLKCLKGEEYNWLIGIVAKNERIRLLKTLKVITDIKIGDLVSVELDNNSGTKRVNGYVRSIGPVTAKIGYYFGIHLEVGKFLQRTFITTFWSIV